MNENETASEFSLQLTTWCETRIEIQFAVDQVLKYGDSVQVRERAKIRVGREGSEYAVFRKPVENIEE